MPRSQPSRPAPQLLNHPPHHLPLNPERLLPEPPSHQTSLTLNTPPLRQSPLLGQPPLIPPNLHQPPRQQPQPRQSENRQSNQGGSSQAGHWNLAIACAAPVAYAPNNASKYGALSGATCTNA